MKAEDIIKLSEPFPPDAIHWRIGAKTRDGKKALGLAYLDARDIMNRLDEVCGPANWQNTYRDCGNGRLVCQLMIRIDGEWLGKSDGAGETQVEGEKGSFSGALKRAAVCWGIGRYLYDLPPVWVALEPNGKEFTIDGLKQLRRSLTAVNSPIPPDDLTPSLSEMEVDDLLNEAEKLESKAQLRSFLKKWELALRKSGYYTQFANECKLLADKLPERKGGKIEGDFRTIVP